MCPEEKDQDGELTMVSTEEKQFRRAGMIRVINSLENCQVVEELDFLCVLLVLRTKSYCGEIVAPI